MKSELPHASTRVSAWLDGWQRAGRLVLLLDYDGTLAPIVGRPELALPAPGAREAVEQLRRRDGVEVAIVSGRGLEDARERFGVERIAYAGNHGMEIEGPGVHRIHAEAAAARPLLEQVAAELSPALREIDGALVEDKGLTLSIHYRLVDPARIEQVRQLVTEAVAHFPALRLTEGKMVLEVRPRVEWDKGRAVEFLLESFAPPAGAPVLYIGDDTTDEDAFRALRAWGNGSSGEGVLVSDDPPGATAARSSLRDPQEVVELLRALAGP